MGKVEKVSKNGQGTDRLKIKNFRFNLNYDNLSPFAKLGIYVYENIDKLGNTLT